MLIVTVLIIVTSVTRYKSLAKMDAFARANNVRFLFDRKNVMYAGLIFAHGDSRAITESYEFPNGTEIGNYTYATGSGRSRQVHYWGYVHIRLPRKLPHMLLDSKKNNFLGGVLSSLPTSLESDQTMRLEGDFNDFFSLYAPKGYERDALYVFSPDVMAALIDHGNQYDIEVIDDTLFLYQASRFALSNEQAVRSLIEVSDTIRKELHEQTDYYADERVGDRSANIIAEPGRRLRRQVSIAGAIFGVIFLIYFLVNFLQTVLP